MWPSRTSRGVARTAAAGPRPEVDVGRPSRSVRVAHGLRRHAGLIALLAAGAALRVLARLAAVLGSMVLLAWGDELGRVPAVLSGVLLGYAGVARSVAVPCIVIFVLYLLLRRVGWRGLVLFCAGWLLVVGGYATLFRVQ